LLRQLKHNSFSELFLLLAFISIVLFFLALSLYAFSILVVVALLAFFTFFSVLVAFLLLFVIFFIAFHADRAVSSIWRNVSALLGVVE
jgi:hypothetical protein